MLISEWISPFRPWLGTAWGGARGGARWGAAWAVWAAVSAAVISCAWRGPRADVLRVRRVHGRV